MRSLPVRIRQVNYSRMGIDVNIHIPLLERFVARITKCVVAFLTIGFDGQPYEEPTMNLGESLPCLTLWPDDD